MLSILDVLLTLIHFLVILFNLFGWIPKRTRRWHLYVVGITLASWLLLGIKYGLGYCFLTDWHWRIKRQLGEADLPHSFIDYVIQEVGLSASDSAVFYMTLLPFLMAIIMSLYLNFFRSRR
jgi:hypothetical protein